MRRLGILIILLLLGCAAPQQMKTLQPWESFAQQQWSGFTAQESKRVTIGWCVSGEFKGQKAAEWIIPYQQSYLVKRQYLDTQACQLPEFNLPLE